MRVCVCWMGIMGCYTAVWPFLTGFFRILQFHIARFFLNNAILNIFYATYIILLILSTILAQNTMNLFISNLCKNVILGNNFPHYVRTFCTYRYILSNHLKTFSDNDDNGLYHLLEEQVFTFEFHPTFSPKNFCFKVFHLPILECLLFENATEISFMVRRIFFSQEARSVDLLLHNTHKRIHKPVGTFSYILDFQKQ